MKGYIFFITCLFVSHVRTQDTIPLFLSGAEVKLLIFGNDSSDVLLYNMHDNENTSALAGRIISQKYKGEYFELIHDGKRNLSFLLGEDSIHIDPNRIYTDTGVWMQLQKNKITDTLAFQLISAWRDQVLSVLAIKERSLVIALHNNTEENYSFKSYLPDQEYEKEAQSYYHGCTPDYDDFFFVTDHTILHALIAGQYNVVLQANETMTDDGSLSVYCAKLGIPYVNVEAQHGHIWRQLYMLIFALQKLKE
jgi:hypothetical protein